MKKFIITAILAAGCAFGQISIGVQIGRPPVPRVVRVQPRSPGQGYVLIQGYWYPNGRKYKWHDGYWTRPPYEGARWVEPRHDGQRFFDGYWEGDRGRKDHDHKWDRDRNNRDYRGERR
ncbi:MAG: YXWGXW repeat-containing protein [Acidobacteriota bacterium]